MKYVVFARHGNCEDKQPYGLNEVGRTQIRRLGEAINHVTPNTIWNIVSSPLERAKQSAACLVEILRMEDRSVQVEECLIYGREHFHENNERVSIKPRTPLDIIREHEQNGTSGLLLLTHLEVMEDLYRNRYSKRIIGRENEYTHRERDYGKAYFFDLEAKTVRVLPE